MDSFLNLWSQSAVTSLGLFWMAFWAFGLGYVISSMIQVFVTEKRMKETMGSSGIKSVGLGTFFGFISSSCSFAALSTTRVLFAKGAGLVPALAFLLASTNLVVELGIVISIFLSWQFVVGEYIGGLLLILLMAVIVKLTLPNKLEELGRENARQQESQSSSDQTPDWKKLIASKKGWNKVSRKYLMEWKMVWKDVTIGFTVAGIIAVFVPSRFFESLFIGAGSSDPAFYEILLQSLVGPLAAFFTFIGSMGNIPLAAVLYSNGVSFAGVMAFIFSDLVVLPVLRIQAKYYGWRMALYILAVFLVILVTSSLIMHYGFSLTGILPEAASAQNVTEREFFEVNYGFFFNVVFIILSAISLYIYIGNKNEDKGGSATVEERVLSGFTFVSIFWLVGGTLLGFIL